MRTSASGFPHQTHPPTITWPVPPITKEQQRGSFKTVPSKYGSPRVRFFGYTVNVCSSAAIHIIPPDGPLCQLAPERVYSGSSFLVYFICPRSLMSPLSSTIIQDIKVMQEAGRASMGYFYFDFRDASKQHRRDLLTSLLFQLSAHSSSHCGILSLLHAAHDDGARQPTDQELTKCLKKMLRDQRPIYLIIDALDESPDASGIPSPREEVLQLITELVGLSSTDLQHLHICVTSRQQVDIRIALRHLTTFRVGIDDRGGQRNDIVDYVTSVVYSNAEPIMRGWEKEVKDLVIETLCKRADGM